MATTITLLPVFPTDSGYGTNSATAPLLPFPPLHPYNSNYPVLATKRRHRIRDAADKTLIKPTVLFYEHC